MKKRGARATKRNIREVRSDDEVSDSDVVNETDKFHEDIDEESGMIPALILILVIINYQFLQQKK